MKKFSSTTSKRKAKSQLKRPPKPYSSFPLTPYANGKYVKQIRGKHYFFGNWARRKTAYSFAFQTTVGERL